MKVLYHIPSTSLLSAGRTYFYGFKHAFEDLGHQFLPLTADDNQAQVFEHFKPDIFITGLNPYLLKYLDFTALKKSKKRGMRVFVNVPFWTSPFSPLRITENGSLSSNQEYIKLITSGKYGDFFFNTGEQGDPRMEGFTKSTGYAHITLPLAADKTLIPANLDHTFASDICFIGTYLPGRREFMKKYVFPLKKKYHLKLYCQDLSLIDRTLNFSQKVGQYLNLPVLRSFKKNNVSFEEERKIIGSATISLNIHEEYQKHFGMDCNDRTFKIPLLNGFEISDDVACIKKYLKPDKEIVIAKDGNDWFEKIDHYLKYPEQRLAIIKAGRARVLKDHTYHNRVHRILSLAGAP